MEAQFFPAGEIGELKQTVKSFEDQITVFGAQVHNLEMDSLEKDARIEKHEGQVKSQEGVCVNNTCTSMRQVNLIPEKSIT